MRADPPLVLPGACKVICVALAYPGVSAGESSVGWVARYARGADYHEVVGTRLRQLWQEVQQRYPDAGGRVFVDAGPLPERELARRAGLGWVGKHSCLIHPRLGSRFVLGEILTTLALAPTPPITGSCGACNRCLAACPTGALVAPGVVDARRCLSYLTIEHKGPIPQPLRPLLGLRLFGCDTCQDACPHNLSASGSTTVWSNTPELPCSDLPALLTMPPEEFTCRFHNTPLARTKRRGVVRNACVVLGNLGEKAAIPALLHALHDVEPLVRGHAAWALQRLGQKTQLAEMLAVETDPWVRMEMGAERE